MKFAYINGKILNGDKDMQVRQGLVIVTDGEKITVFISIQVYPTNLHYIRQPSAVPSLPE